MTEKSVRIDKWLWACRFFKTRSLAKQAIDGGKVRVNDMRAKPSRELQVGDVVQCRLGWDERIFEVLVLSDQRRGAPDAQKLYVETAESIKVREETAEKRKAGAMAMLVSDQKPNKKQRRQIHRFKQDM